VALHAIPDDEQDGRHQRTPECPCRPARAEGHATVGVGRQRFPYRGPIYTHGPLAAPAPEPEVAPGPVLELHDRIAVDDDDPEQGPEASCGHVIVDVDGEQQHHDIPDDGEPHAPTTECGCGPQRNTSEQGHVVYEHVDQGADVEALYREVFGS
jgi:hypothetical protein